MLRLNILSLITAMHGLGINIRSAMAAIVLLAISKKRSTYIRGRSKPNQLPRHHKQQQRKIAF